MKPKYDLTHARHDPAHCLAPGLFRSLQRGERKRLKLDVTYSFGEGESMRFVGFEPLGADDMRLLQGVVALGGPHGILLKPAPTTQTGKQLLSLLQPKHEATKQDGLVVKESLTRLLREIGMSDGGANIRAIKESLLRMSNVTVLAKKGARQAAFHLMSHAIDEKDGRIWIALNPRIAEAILSRRPHTRIDMKEVRELRTDPARLIHQRLSGWIDPGKSGRIELDKICGYIWPEETNENAMKRRRGIARRSLGELVTVGWVAEEYSRGKWVVTRPRQSPSSALHLHRRRSRRRRSNSTQAP